MSYTLHLEMAEGVEEYYKCKGCKGYFEHQPSKKKMAVILFREKLEERQKKKNVSSSRGKVFISWMGDFHEWHLNAWLISCRFTFVSTISLDSHLFYFQVPNFPSSPSIIFSSFYTIRTKSRAGYFFVQNFYLLTIYHIHYAVYFLLRNVA